MLRTTEELRDVVLKSPTMQDIALSLKGRKFESLQQSGFKLVAEGAVAFGEIDRTVGREARASK